MAGKFDPTSFDGSPGGFDTDPFASNWQASNWQHPSSRKPTRDELKAQRQSLGIEDVDDAVKTAAEATTRIEAAVGLDRDITEDLAAQKAAEEAYLAAYRETLLAEEIINQFRMEVEIYRFEMRRRAALLLLLN